MFRRRRAPKEPPAGRADAPRPISKWPDPTKYEITRDPRPSELYRRGLFNIEDYIPDENGRTRREG